MEVPLKMVDLFRDFPSKMDENQGLALRKPASWSFGLTPAGWLIGTFEDFVEENCSGTSIFGNLQMSRWEN